MALPRRAKAAPDARRWRRPGLRQGCELAAARCRARARLVCPSLGRPAPSWGGAAAAGAAARGRPSAEVLPRSDRWQQQRPRLVLLLGSLGCSLLLHCGQTDVVEGVGERLHGERESGSRQYE